MKQWRVLTSPGYRRGACANKPGGTQVSWRAPSEVCAVSWPWRVGFSLTLDRWVSGLVDTGGNCTDAERLWAALLFGRSFVSPDFPPRADRSLVFAVWETSGSWDGDSETGALPREARVASDDAGIVSELQSGLASFLPSLSSGMDLCWVIRLSKRGFYTEVGHRRRWLEPPPPPSRPCV